MVCIGVVATVNDRSAGLYLPRSFRCMESDHTIGEWDDTSTKAPRCAQCGQALRPDVYLYPETPNYQQMNIFGLPCEAEIVILLGFMMLDQWNNGVPNIARRSSAYVLSMSLRPPFFSSEVHHHINYDLAEAIPELAALITQQKQQLEY
jgi:NAD-dependent SIR2 family protein deacetylase